MGHPFGTRILVRPAEAGDREFVIRTAERLAAFEPPPWRSGREIIEGEVRTLVAYFDAPPPGAALVVAEEPEGERLGFAYLEAAHDYFTQEEHGHVGILAVTSQAEGRGAGSALLLAAERWARAQQYRRLTLNVFAPNERARDVYERHGYAIETIRYVKPLTDPDAA